MKRTWIVVVQESLVAFNLMAERCRKGTAVLISDDMMRHPGGGWMGSAVFLSETRVSGAYVDCSEVKS